MIQRRKSKEIRLRGEEPQNRRKLKLKGMMISVTRKETRREGELNGR